MSAASAGFGIAIAAVLVCGEARAQAANGNPLSSVPLSSLSATRDRPLFSQSRRPPPAAAVAPPAAPLPIVAAVAEQPEGPPFTLLGTLLGPEARIAIFMNEHTRLSTRIHEGDSDSGWRLVSIDSRSAVFQGAGQVVTVNLPEKSANSPLSVAIKAPLSGAYDPAAADSDPDADDAPRPALQLRRRPQR